MHLIVMNCTLLYCACIAIRNQEIPSTPPIKEESMMQEQKAKVSQLHGALEQRGAVGGSADVSVRIPSMG